MIEELRQYIRHPSSIPISYRLGQRHHIQPARDISQGGLCFTSQERALVGESIFVEIKCGRPGFSAEGIVRWCSREGRKYLIGVGFRDRAVQYAMRMVEQVCHIEAFRHRLEQETGVKLTSEQAAFRWIAENAADFPAAD
ncbi:PilZ domain-containing protein [Methylophaga sp. OBS1]|jgi:hypothetical protein|uniref:PilZ domain-containing protein n=1 Tax=Methylophaga sp. OBS1 TaxID=2991933 RepID=UPI00225631EA|nr:PilZ domain-containing protein [Methylophaga sp. OBS1]MCX4191473.1 PilZ domain-containing protein [Methylophaga sp. OBS1]MCX4191582.1 PilZ domain-containing protein [Methylophaga sp. OBS1]